MRKTLSQLIEEQLASQATENLVYEQIEVFEEAINSFNDLPNSWKKSATGPYSLQRSDLKAGEGSKVVVLSQKGSIKGDGEVGKLFRKYLSKNQPYAAVWLEVNDEPLVMAERAQFYNETDVSLRFQNGNLATVNKQIGRDRKTRMPIYKDIPTMKLADAADKVSYLVYDLARTSVDPDKTMKFEEYSKLIDDLYKSGKFQITIKGLTVDKNREDLSAARSANKPLPNGANLPADIAVKVEAAKKVVKNKIDARLEKIKAEFDKILTQSLNGDGKLDFQKIQSEVSAIQDVTYRLNSYVNEVSKYGKSSWEKDRLVRTLAELQKIA